MAKALPLYTIETVYFDNEPMQLKKHRMRNITWHDLRVFRETVFSTGLYVGNLDNVAFGDGHIIPPNDIRKIYVYLQKEKFISPTGDELM